MSGQTFARLYEHFGDLPPVLEPNTREIISRGTIRVFRLESSYKNFLEGMLIEIE